MFHNGEELHMSKSFSDAEMASMRNVAGEIFGSMAAIDVYKRQEITTAKDISNNMNILSYTEFSKYESKKKKPVDFILIFIMVMI